MVEFYERQAQDLSIQRSHFFLAEVGGGGGGGWLIFKAFGRLKKVGGKGLNPHK